MLDPAAIRALTFDCYGTLIDWETGIQRYVAPHLERAAGGRISLGQWFARWEAIQFDLLVPGRRYREILIESFEETMRSFELEVFADGGPGLAASLVDWQPFPDVVLLRRLARRRRIGIISNIDDALFAHTAGQLAAPLSLVVTAEEAGAYKPSRRPFEVALERLGLPASAVLHVAFGWKYDLAPAHSLGMQTCWLNRSGVARPETQPIVLEVASLAALVDLLP